MVKLLFSFDILLFISISTSISTVSMLCKQEVLSICCVCFFYCFKFIYFSFPIINNYISNLGTYFNVLK